MWGQTHLLTIPDSRLDKVDLVYWTHFATCAQRTLRDLCPSLQWLLLWLSIHQGLVNCLYCPESLNACIIHPHRFRGFSLPNFDNGRDLQVCWSKAVDSLQGYCVKRITKAEYWTKAHCLFVFQYAELLLKWSIKLL